MRRIAPFVFVLAATAASAPTFGQTPLGAAAQINSETAGAQLLPDIAMHSSGFGWVVWTTFGGTGGPNVAVRSFDATGALGTEFVHNTNTDGDQRNPQIEVNAAGNRATVWRTIDQFSPTSDEDAILRWTHDNVLEGEHLGHLNSDPDPEGVDVAIHSDESFISVWREDSTIEAHRYSRLGASLGGDELIASNVIEGHFDVAALPAGRSVVVFSATAGNHGAYGRLVAADGSGIGFAFPLAEDENVARSEVSVDSDGSSGFGGFVVSWFDYAVDHVFARVFDSDGLPLTGDIQVTTSPVPVATKVRLARGPNGDFVVAWTRRDEVGDPYDLWVREFFATGAPAGAPLLVEGVASADLNAIAMSSNRFIPVWEAPDADGDGIWGRLYQRKGLFADNFETGNSGQWSAD